MAGNTLIFDLGRALHQIDIIWADLLRDSESFPHLENRIHCRLKANEIGNIRQALTDAMIQANNLFDNNMQCLSHIVHLQAAISAAATKFEDTNNNAQSKAEGLLYVIASQQHKINQMLKTIKLKDFWGNLLIAHRTEDDNELHESCALALCWLSAQCAQDVSTSQGIILNESMRNSSILSINGSYHQLTGDGDCCDHSAKFFKMLLQKVNTLHEIATEDNFATMKKIADLNRELDKKNEEIRETMQRQEQLLNEISLRDLEIANNMKWISELESSLVAKDLDINTARSCQADLEKKLEELEKECNRITNLFQLSMVAREEWRIVCDTIRKNVDMHDQLSSTVKIPSAKPALPQLHIPEAIEYVESSKSKDNESGSPAKLAIKPPFLPPSPHGRSSHFNATYPASVQSHMPPSPTYSPRASPASTSRTAPTNPHSPRIIARESSQKVDRSMQRDSAWSHGDEISTHGNVSRESSRTISTANMVPVPVPSKDPYASPISNYQFRGSRLLSETSIGRNEEGSNELWDRFITLDEVLLTNVVQAVADRDQFF